LSSQFAILSGIFVLIYRKSDHKDFSRWWQSFKAVAIIAGVLSGLIPVDTEAMEPSRNKNQVYQEILISDQEFNSFENKAKTGDSGPSVSTSPGRRQPSQSHVVIEQVRGVSETSSININEVILVKDNGILPGTDGFPLNNNPRKRHPQGPPRIRGRGMTVDLPQNIQGLGNIPEAPKVRSFREVDTGLNARWGNPENQSPAPEFDMKEQYENFLQEMSEKGYELECSQERFNELLTKTNPQTGSPDEKSLIEAKRALQGEAEGMYTNTCRPRNKAVDLDFEIDSSKGYTLKG